VHHEQGMGDTIQFSRYIADLSQLGAKIFFAPQMPLRRLFDDFEGVQAIVDETDLSLTFDYHIPLLSIPHLLHTEIDKIPECSKYLFAEGENIRKWQSIIGHSRYKVGICWQGSTGQIDKGRSFPLEMFTSISKLNGVRLINLHRGAGESQIKGQSFDIETFQFELEQEGHAFVDTAAVMENLDLIITSDTAVAHLAGALGRPVWTVLQKVPDWRWFLDRSDTPWYPTMRLFRQRSFGDWDTVFREVEAELKLVLNSTKSSVINNNG
jgi:Glycosyltransferase family 9 (heptosyltransferase)